MDVLYIDVQQRWMQSAASRIVPIPVWNLWFWQRRAAWVCIKDMQMMLIVDLG